MARKSVQAYALFRAVNILGGTADVAKLLGISQTKLKVYLEGLQAVTDVVFLKVIDFLFDKEMERLAKETGAQRSASDRGARTSGNGKAVRHRKGNP